MGGVPIAARKGGPLARNGRQASLLIGAGGQRRDPSRHVVFWRTRYLGVQSVARTLFSFKRPSLVRVCMFALPRFNDLGKFCFVASSIALKDGALSNGTASLRHSFLFFLPLLCFSRFVFLIYIFFNFLFRSSASRFLSFSFSPALFSAILIFHARDGCNHALDGQQPGSLVIHGKYRRLEFYS